MTGDIYTKGFQNKHLFKRLKMLINIYEVGYFEKTFVLKREDLTPTPLNNDASPMDKSEIPNVLNT